MPLRSSTTLENWAERLGKGQLKAQQISARVGDLLCTLRSDRITLASRAVAYLVSAIAV